MALSRSRSKKKNIYQDLKDIQQDLKDVRSAITALLTKMGTGFKEASSKSTEETITNQPNTLPAAINKLPIELLSYIILLAHSSINTLRDTHAHPYLSYTWVCRHWRYILIYNPVFWTLIQPPLSRELLTQETFYHELFRRSGSSKVDVILLPKYTKFDTMLENLFVKESSRVRNLRLSNFGPLVLSGIHFPSLRGFALIDDCGPSYRIFKERLHVLQLLSILTASNHLDTFQCTLYEHEWTRTCKDQMASIFSRLRNLSLTLGSAEIVGPVLDLLHNNARLQSLQLSSQTHNTEISSGQLILPELGFLSIKNFVINHHIQCPKLFSLSAAHKFPARTPDHLILKEMDLSSLKYLWIRENCPRDRFGYCILGTKERIDCGTVFSEKMDILFGDYPVYEYCFHLKLSSRDTSTSAVKKALSSIIPQLISLIELHLLFPRTYSVCRKIIPQLPSVQKIIVESGNGLMGLLRLLNNPSRCPQLTHLSYTTVSVPKNLKEYAENVGRKLTNCLQSRQDNAESASNVALKYINLGNCPPLPNIWLEELRKLGAEIVTKQKNTVSFYFNF
ncbi:hypothetical protein Clacol_009663 [Clathrus columnatus]|uniref:F-box domain-containing protein n=1 Tax=Clathrus columnatus TaxID=1419009 RepID=A0AAV5ANN8_9AGAM|nr:hypothetical protein Clacol_009663 [Clathrus columnatus]